MKLKNPIVFWLLIVFTAGNLLDSFTTFFVLPGEANPIYLMTGSVWVLIVFKMLLTISLWWFYFKAKFKTHFQYYNLILVLVMSATVLLFASISNIFNLLTVAPEVIAQQAAVSAGTKIKYYTYITSLIYLMPYAMSLLSFYLYEKSKHNVRFKVDEYFRK